MATADAALARIAVVALTSVPNREATARVYGQVAGVTTRAGGARGGAPA